MVAWRRSVAIVAGADHVRGTRCHARRVSERALPKWLPTAGVAFALALLVVMSFLERWSMLNQTAFPVGVDGYYYPLQLRSLLESHELAYPSVPIAFWLMTPLAALTDPITGAKIGAALFGALVALPAYGIGARLGRCRGAGLVAAVIATTSAGSAFLSIEFVKNGIGLTVLLTAVWLLMRALEKPSIARLVPAVLGALAAAFTHKMAGALLVVIAVPSIIAAASARGRLRGRRLLYVISLVSSVTVLLVILSMTVSKRATDIDLSRVVWADRSHWTAPALVTRSFQLTFGYEALIGACVGIAALFVLSRAGRGLVEKIPIPAHWRAEATRRGLSGETAIAWTIALLAIAIAWPRLDVTDVQGLGFRLRVASFVPFALAAAVVTGRLVARIKHRDFALAVVAVALAMRPTGHRDEGRIDVHPAMASAVQALKIPDTETIIVPERHIVFMVAWYARAHVQIRPEGVAPEHRWRLVPLAWIGMDSPLDTALLQARNGPRPPVGLHARHPNGLVLIPEETYQRVLESLPADVRTYWSRWRTI